MFIPTSGLAQTPQPAQPSAAAEPQLPPEAQTKLDGLKTDLKAAQAAGDVRAEAKTLNGIGNVYFGISEYQKALDDYNQALAQARAAKDAQEEAAALNGIGSCYGNQSQNSKALKMYQQALDLATASGDLRDQAVSLNGLGWVNRNAGQPQKALEFHNRALPLARKVKDEDLEATILRRIGIVYDDLGEPQKALDYYNQVLPIYRRVGDRHGEADTLTSSGIVYKELGEKQKALDYLNQALPIRRQVGDRYAEARTLNNIGTVYNELGEKQKALDYFNQALPIMRQVGDRQGEALTLNNIGTVYDVRGEKQKALDYYNQALQILRQVGNRHGEALTLNNIGTVYVELGEKQKALDYFNQTLPIRRQVGDRYGEAVTLNNIGIVYKELGEPQKALDYYNQTLPIRRQVDDREGEAETLNNIGVVYYGLGEPQKALDYLNQALPILRQVGNREGEAETLNNIGDVYRGLGEPQKALDYLNQALPLATAVSDPLLEASISHSVMLNQQSQHPSLAIFYGKEAVNFVQQVRGNIQNLDKELQRSFLSSKNDYFHDLADLLIDQGRLPEAQQVLDLMKQQEYLDFVRGETATTLSPLSLTPAERQAEEDYQRSTAQLVSLGEQWSQLKKITSRTPEQEKQYQQLSDALTKASQGLNDYYSRLYILFGKNSDANKQVADVKGDTVVLKQQIAKMPHTVALYTVVAKDRYSVLVISGTGQIVGRKYDITEKDLNQKVAAFQQVLRDPRQDPRPLAQELYRILIGPVKADLDQAQAQTLVWSLDGVLRYIPMSALYDGKQYLAENYSLVAITPASISHLADMPKMENLSAVGMGISRKYEDGLDPLPAVAGELEDIVKDPRVKDAHGVLPGSILLNGQFTEKAMEEQLDGQHPVVHIASHFVLKSGDESQSYLLLAGKESEGHGYHLSVAYFRDDQKMSLDNTDLLTLSACETGVGSNAGNGREVDGLATTAQLKGAKAVISSLWAVDDSSTGELMADFYQRWAEGGGKVLKAEALRQAQVDLLSGKIKPKPDFANPNAPTSYAHPYYWAPFILMGNWR